MVVDKAVLSDGLHLEVVAPNFEVNEVLYRPGRCGEGRPARSPRRCARSTDDVGDAVDRLGALVVVIVPGEDQRDAEPFEQRLECLAYVDR